MKEYFTMHMKVLLPFQVFAEHTDVTRIVVETTRGSFGLLPRRLDCAAVLVPGILAFESAKLGEQFIAVDEGVMVKVGRDVSISVRHAIGGSDLGSLREAVEREFVNLNERERSMRTVLAKLESSFMRRLLELHRA